MSTPSLETLARARGVKVHRQRGSDRVWLIKGGRLISPSTGHREAAARTVLNSLSGNATPTKATS